MALAALSALGHEQRLDIFRFLVKAGPDGAVAGDVAAVLGALPNTLSANLSILAQAGLVGSTREGRNIRYRAEMEAMQALVSFLLEDCCGGDASLCAPVFEQLGFCGCEPEKQNPREATVMEQKVFNVLFLCTGNSARSIMAEAILNREGGGKFRAYSAGSNPKGEVNPYALQLLQKQNYATDALRSKSWDEFAEPEAPVMDFVFTVCDNAAKEVCPVWPGQPMSAHWGVPDPATVEGGDTDKALAFADAFRMLDHRISLFTSLPVSSIERLSLQKQLEAIGTEKP